MPESGVEIHYVRHEDFSRFVPLIDKALQRGGGRAFTVDDVLSSLKDGARRLFVGIIDREPKGILITEIIEVPNYRYMLVFLLSGEGFQEWINEAEGFLKLYATSMDCKLILADTRRGLSKMLQTRGWKHESDTMVLTL